MTNLIPTNLKPLFSNLPKIWLIKPLWTPSGLIAIKVLSSAIVVFVCSNGYFGMEVSMWGKGKGEEEEKKRRKVREGRKKKYFNDAFIGYFFFLSHRPPAICNQGGWWEGLPDLQTG